MPNFHPAGAHIGTGEEFQKCVADRNTIKRHIREGYRQHKHTLTTSRPLCLAYI